MPSPVETYVQIGGTDVFAGRLWAHRRGQVESATFRYAPEYLAHRDAYELDPQLPLVDGPLQTGLGRKIFGAFADCAPDRWGRRLVQRAERQRAAGEGAGARSFGEVDYVLGVRDDLRQGALRFRDPESLEFLATEHSGVPHLLELPRLLNAADHLERDDPTADDVRTLLRAGSSLGGARPKAHVISQDGRIAIAKFPSPTNDEWDVIRWEAVALELASRCGIRVPTWDLHVVDGKAVLVVGRFDRQGAHRIAYASALTMLEATDGDAASYLDIADAIERQSPDTTADLRELWRRIAFSVLVSNTDDHLRNHGFLRVSTAGWTLAPAFDLNPDPRPGTKHLSTAIGSDTTAAIGPLLEVAEFFRLRADEARTILSETAEATRGWRSVAEGLGLNRLAIADMAPAFEHEQARAARALPAGKVSP